MLAIRAVSLPCSPQGGPPVQMRTWRPIGMVLLDFRADPSAVRG